MKTFVFSSITLIILICIVTYSGIYINDTTEDMLSMTAELPLSLEKTLSMEEGKDANDLRQALYDINLYWHEKRTIILLNVSHSEIDKIDTSLARLSAACISEDNGEYTAARALLLDELIDLRESENFSVKGIL